MSFLWNPYRHIELVQPDPSYAWTSFEEYDEASAYISMSVCNAAEVTP